MALKSYEQYLEEADARRDWIINQVENTDKTHDQIKKEFLKKYPGQGKYFDKVVSQIVD